MLRLFEIASAVTCATTVILWVWIRYSRNLGLEKERRHSLPRRLLWHPAIVAILTAYFAERTWRLGLSLARTGGLLVSAVWLVLSVFDFMSNHKLLDWLYDDESAVRSAK
jgi:hypothetical protein